MSIQADFVTLAGPILAGRMYPSVAPDSPVTPYAVYFRVSGTEVSTLDTNGGAGNANHTRLQLDVWAKTYAEAQSIAAAVKTALKDWTVENNVLLEQDMYESETKLHRVMLDISTWHF
jgi:hypothetical protein